MSDRFYWAFFAVVVFGFGIVGSSPLLGGTTGSVTLSGYVSPRYRLQLHRTPPAAHAERGAHHVQVLELNNSNLTYSVHVISRNRGMPQGNNAPAVIEVLSGSEEPAKFSTDGLIELPPSPTPHYLRVSIPPETRPDELGYSDTLTFSVAAN